MPNTTENILIQFESDTAGIKSAQEAFDEFAGVDKALKDQFDKTNAAIKERAAIVDVVVGSLEQMTSTLRDAGKRALEAFGTKGMVEFKRNIAENTNTIKLMQLAIMNAAVQRDKLVKGTAQWEALNKQVVDGVKVFQDLGFHIDDAEGKTVSLRTQLREMKNELYEIDDPNNPRFLQLASEAAELKDRIGDLDAQIALLSSDTSGLDAGIQVVQGLTGAFAAAQGAMAILGADSDEMQQSLLRVNAAMAIMQGIQEVSAMLDKNSALNIFLIKNLRLQQAAATEAVAVAEGVEQVATEGATTAQLGLNAAMAANPAGILLLALGTLVGLIEIFIGDTAKAAKAQELLNLSFQEGIKTNNGFVDAIKDSREKNRVSLEAHNASAAALRQNDIKSLQEQLTQTAKFENARAAVYEQAADRINELRKQRTLDKDDERELAALQKTVDEFSDLQKKRFDLERELEDAQVQDEKAAFNERLKNHTAFVEANVLKTQEGSRNELVAEIAAIRAREQEELKSAAHLPGEVEKITSQANRDVAAKRQQIRLFDLNQEKFVIDARLQATIKGSEEELTARVDLLDQEEKIEVASAQGNKKKILDIEATYNKERVELYRTYNKQVAEDEINTRVQALNSIIANTTTGNSSDAVNQDILDAKKKLLDEQAALEVISINASEWNEELRAAKIKAVYDKQLADKRELERAKTAAEISEQEGLSNALSSLLINRANRERTASTTGYTDRQKASADFYNQSLNQLVNQLGFEEDRYNKGLISYTEYQEKKLGIQDQMEALSLQKTEEAEAKRQAIIGAAMSFASTITNGYFDSLKAGYDQDLAETQDLQNKKLITQQEADRRSRQIKRQEAIVEREAAVFGISLSMAQAIMAHQKAQQWLIPFDIAMGIAQTAFVMGKPLPRYRKGKIKIDGEGTETSDSILAMLSKHESVINAEATKRYQPALEAINELRFEEYLSKLTLPVMNVPQFELPAMGALPRWTQTATHAAAPFDYDKMADAFAAKVGKIKDVPGVDVRIDKDGIAIIAKEGLNRTEFINNKYSFRL